MNNYAYKSCTVYFLFYFKSELVDVENDVTLSF